MADIFWKNQSKNMQEEYVEFLQIIGSLSNLFSDSLDPYLYYRAHENLFCQVFDAKNLARGDISYDATKDGVGIGLKTFLNGNGKTFQKVAEFNSDSHLFRGLSKNDDIIEKVAELRNKRIELTQNIAEADASIYHLVTREREKMNIIETTMDFVDTGSIRLNKIQSKNTIRFKDKYNEYSFSLSKNTLSKRFDTSKSEIITQFSVSILENPFDFLKKNQLIHESRNQHSVIERDFIILPLYSPRSNLVEERSGLNQWNANGRTRNVDEVYIPIPLWIHETYREFFVYSRLFRGQSTKNSPIFSVELPNGEILSCKVAQAGGKALMSNPNKALGKWILRDVLRIPEGTLVTIKMLNELGIDSVKLTKIKDDYYTLDFMKSGSYKEFEENNKI